MNRCLACRAACASLLTLCFGALVTNAYGQNAPYNPPSVIGQLLTTPPTIDGSVTAEEWAEAVRTTGFVDPITRQPTDDQTEVLVGYTAEGIYVAFICTDSVPSSVVGQTTQDGVNFQGEDFVVLILDPQNTRSAQGLSQFEVNVLGAKREQISGGRAGKREWRGLWKAAAQKTDTGWTAEMMVPWSILNTPSGSTGDMSINFARIQNRTKVLGFWADLTERRLMDRNGVMTGVTFPRAAKPKLEYMGYLSPEYDEDNSPQFSLRSGIDLRYKPTLQSTAVLSVNPDFKNIENEVVGIEFVRGERFLSETRPFFTEGAGYFNVQSQIGQLFYSRRIDDFDQGVKYFGQLNPRTRIGVLATREDGERNDAVAKVTYQLDSRSNINAFMTHRGVGGFDNTVYGITGNAGRGNYGAQWEFVESSNDGDKAQAANLALFYSVPRFLLFGAANYVQPDFRTSLGLVPFTNRRGGFLYSEYNAEYRQGGIRSVSGELVLESSETFQKTNFQKGISGGISATTRQNMAFGINGYTDRFLTEESKEFGGFVGFNVDNRYRNAYLSYRAGERAGRSTSFMNASGTLRLGGIDFGLSHSLLRFDGETDQTIFTVGWEIDKTRALTARFVRQDGDTNWYLAYRNAGGEGLEWFLIVGDPNARTSRDRIALKLVWAG